MSSPTATERDASTLRGIARAIKADGRLASAKKLFDIAQRLDRLKSNPSATGDMPALAAAVRSTSAQDVVDALDVAECCVHDQIKDPVEREHVQDALKTIRLLALGSLHSANEPSDEQIMALCLDLDLNAVHPVGSVMLDTAAFKIREWLRSTSTRGNSNGPAT